MTETVSRDVATGQPAEFDAYAGSYADAVNDSISFIGLDVDYFTRVKAGYILDLIAAHRGDPQQVDLLDVGCGVGNFHPMLQDHLGSLSGCDISAACLETAAQRNPGVTYRHYDGGRLPFGDAQFDAVTAICVMHHVPPGLWPQFSAELRRVLRPGGIALVFEHNPRNPLAVRAVNNCEFDENAVLLRHEQTKMLLAKAGFSDVSARSILTLPSFGRLTRRIDGLFGRLPLGAQYFAMGRA